MSVLGISRSQTTDQPVEDFYSQRSLEAMFAAEQPDTVINCVGLVGHDAVESDPALGMLLNAKVPEIVAKLSASLGFHLVHFSSDAVYSGIPGSGPFDESHTPKPFSLYGEQKLLGESAVAALSASNVCLRVNFFGWSESGQRGLLDHFVNGLLLDRKPIGYGRYRASSLYSGDIAHLMLKIIDLDIQGTFNLGSSDSLSKLEFGFLVADELKIPHDRVVDADPSFWAATGVTGRDLTLNTEKISNALLEPIPTQRASLGRAFADLKGFLRFANVDSADPRWKVSNAVR